MAVNARTDRYGAGCPGVCAHGEEMRGRAIDCIVHGNPLSHSFPRLCRTPVRSTCSTYSTLTTRVAFYIPSNFSGLLSPPPTLSKEVSEADRQPQSQNFGLEEFTVPKLTFEHISKRPDGSAEGSIVNSPMIQSKSRGRGEAPHNKLDGPIVPSTIKCLQSRHAVGFEHVLQIGLPEIAPGAPPELRLSKLGDRMR
jgi:hypothetical protein